MRLFWCFALLAAVAFAAENATESLLAKYTVTEVTKTVLNEDDLPELPALLSTLGMPDKLPDFHSKQIFETRYLLRLKDMDLRVIGLSKAEITTVKAAIRELKREKDILTTRPHPLLLERNGLSYGRLYLSGSLTSYEFYLAVFGNPSPIDEGRLAFAEPRDACSKSLTFFGDTRPPRLPLWRRLWQLVRYQRLDSWRVGADGSKEENKPVFLVAYRGTCSFADKARYAAEAGAAAIIIVNSDEELFRVAAVIAGGKGSEAEALEDPASAADTSQKVEMEIPENIAVVMVRASTGPLLEAAVAWGGGEVNARLVPLACKAGSPECTPVLPEEAAMPLQVKGGRILITTLRNSGGDGSDSGSGSGDQDAAVEFVSASFGTTLPSSPMLLTWPQQADGCGREAATEGMPAAAAAAAAAFGSATVVQRGGCSFGDKAALAQALGARALIVVDDSNAPLQPIGATDAQAKTLYIPAVFITKGAGARLEATAAAAAAHGDTVWVSFQTDNVVAAAWGELAAAALAAEEAARTGSPGQHQTHRSALERAMAVPGHSHSDCRAAWVREALAAMEGRHVASTQESGDDGERPRDEL